MKKILLFLALVHSVNWAYDLPVITPNEPVGSILLKLHITSMGEIIEKVEKERGEYIKEIMTEKIKIPDLPMVHSLLIQRYVAQRLMVEYTQEILVPLEKALQKYYEQEKKCAEYETKKRQYNELIAADPEEDGGLASVLKIERELNNLEHSLPSNCLLKTDYLMSKVIEDAIQQIKNTIKRYQNDFTTLNEEIKGWEKEWGETAK